MIPKLNASELRRGASYEWEMCIRDSVKETLYWGELTTGAYKMEGVTGRADRSLEEMTASAFRMPCAETNEVFVIVASRSHLSAETEEYIRCV